MKRCSQFSVLITQSYVFGTCLPDHGPSEPCKPLLKVGQLYRITPSFSLMHILLQALKLCLHASPLQGTQAIVNLLLHILIPKGF